MSASTNVGAMPPRRLPRVSTLASVSVILGFLRDPLGTVRRVYGRYGPIAEIRSPIRSIRGPRSFVFAVGARYNEQTLGDTAAFRTSGIMLSGPKDSAQWRIRRGIVGMNGAQHVHYRKMLLPPLRRPLVDAMVTRIGEIVAGHLAHWPKNEPTDLWPLVKRLTQDVAIGVLFTAEGESDLGDARRAAALINEHVRMNGLASVKMCPVDVPGTPYHRMMRSAEEVEQYLVPWALKRRGDNRRDDLLSLIVNSPDETGGVAPDRLIASQVLTLFGAAYETCQTILLWSLFLLAQHPQAAARLLDEIAALPTDAPLLAAELNGAGWLDAVVKETMRILPPVPVQMRVATRDTDLGVYEIAQGSRVVLSAFLTNRDPALYPEPDRFKPERWVGARLDPGQYEYLVFSAGPRYCPGFWFGTTLVKVALVHILRAFRIEVRPGARVDRHVSITVSPRHGLPVTLHAQDGRFTRTRVTGNMTELIALD